MTELTDKAKAKAIREERLAKNLRDNLRRRKAAIRKNKDQDKSDKAPESP